MGRSTDFEGPQAGRKLTNLFGSIETLLAAPEGGTSRAGGLLESGLRESLSLSEQFGQAFGDLAQRQREQFIRNDPLASGLRSLGIEAVDAQRGIQQQQADALREFGRITTAGLEGLADGGLPADLERQILNRTRSLGASRGLTDSPLQAVREVGAIIGGEEQVRATRLQQAQAFLSGSLLPGAAPGLGVTTAPSAAQTFSPLDIVNPSSIISTALPTTISAGVQSNLAENQLTFAQNQALGQGIGSLAALGIGQFGAGGAFGLGGAFSSGGAFF